VNVKLTEAEKLILTNQYEVLKGIYPRRKDEFDLISSALQNGYEEDFKQLIGHFEAPLEAGVYREVRNVLEMFRALGPEETSGVRFAGFDGNEEIDHYGYARFLLEDRGLWKESRPSDANYNTHYPVLSEYREMLEEWEKCVKKFDLTPEEVDRITSKASRRFRVSS
jgi:hypothetical protein